MSASVLIVFGPVSDSSGRVYHYKSEDGMTWTRELIGQLNADGSHLLIEGQEYLKVFSKEEREAWFENEPNFSRRIVTALDNSRKGNKAHVPRIFQLIAELNDLLRIWDARQAAHG